MNGNHVAHITALCRPQEMAAPEATNIDLPDDDVVVAADFSRDDSPDDVIS